MQIRELQLFIHLAQSLHFGRTAEALHLSPSAVSRTLRRLEEEVGVPLFERDNRSVRLSAAGRLFLDYARQTVAEWQRLQERLNPDPSRLAGEISLYCSVTAAYSLLAGRLGEFRARYPEIDLKLHTGDQADALDRVLHGHEDLAICARPDQLPRKLRFEALAHSPLLVIVPAANCAVSDSIDAAGTGAPGLPWILSERGVIRERVDQWFRQQGVRPQVYAQVSGHEAIVSMVGLGLGVGIVPGLVLDASPQRDSVRVVPVDPAPQPVAVGLCSLAQRLESPSVAAFWHALVDGLGVEGHGEGGRERRL